MNLTIDSKLFHILSKIADCMIISVLWLLFSLPVFTLGAASSALYFCVIKVLREGEGSASKEFFRAFRENFQQSVSVFLLTLLACVILSAAGSGIYALSRTAVTLRRIYNVYMILVLLGLAYLHYVVCYIARFQAPLKTILKNSLIICLANLPASVSFVVLFVVAAGFMVWWFPASAMGILLLPGLYAWVISLLMERIFRKYMPNEKE